GPARPRVQPPRVGRSVPCDPGRGCVRGVGAPRMEAQRDRSRALGRHDAAGGRYRRGAGTTAACDTWGGRVMSALILGTLLSLLALGFVLYPLFVEHGPVAHQPRKSWSDDAGR